MSDEGAERRRDTRVPLGLEVDLRFDDFASFAMAQGADISLGGMRIETDHLRPIGSRIQFRFAVGRRSILIEGTAKVAWRRPASEPGGKGTLGLQFEELDSFSKEVIETLVRMRLDQPDVMTRLDSEGVELELFDRVATRVLSRRDLDRALENGGHARDESS